MKHTFMKMPGELCPVTDEAKLWFRNIKLGDIIDADVVCPRSQKFHRLFFSMLKIVSDNMDGGSVDNLLDVIKLGIGHTKTIKLRGPASPSPYSAIKRHPFDEYYYYSVPESISFASMDQDTFAAFFTRAVDCVVAEVLPGVDKQALTNEIYSLAGIPMVLMDASDE